jgi:peptidoglycan/xylan/chitin deacetylase (PgdA/CDA1 family)
MDGWPSAKADDVARRIGPKLCDGAIVLMHDASERGDFTPVSLEALPEIHAVAQRRNLSFVTLAQWLNDASA